MQKLRVKGPPENNIHYLFLKNYIVEKVFNAQKTLFLTLSKPLNPLTQPKVPFARKSIPIERQNTSIWEAQNFRPFVDSQGDPAYFNFKLEFRVTGNFKKWGVFLGVGSVDKLEYFVEQIDGDQDSGIA